MFGQSFFLKKMHRCETSPFKIVDCTWCGLFVFALVLVAASKFGAGRYLWKSVSRVALANFSAIIYRLSKTFPFFLALLMMDSTHSSKK